VAIELCKFTVGQQVFQWIPRAFHLEQIGADDQPGGPDDGVAWTGEDFRVFVDWPHPILELADKAVAQAYEILFLRFAEVEMAEKAPDADGNIANEGVLELAEPAYEACH
jgi:hypothetical protein